MKKTIKRLHKTAIYILKQFSKKDCGHVYIVEYNWPIKIHSDLKNILNINIHKVMHCDLLPFCIWVTDFVTIFEFSLWSISTHNINCYAISLLKMFALL